MTKSLWSTSGITLVLGEAVGAMTGHLGLIALPWIVLRASSSSTKMTASILVHVVAATAAILLAGRVLDLVVEKAVVLAMAQTLGALLLTTIWGFLSVGSAPFHVLIAASAALGAVVSFRSVATATAVSLMFASSGELRTANAVVAVTAQLVGFSFPILLGVLLEQSSWLPVVFLELAVASFACALLSILFVSARGNEERQRSSGVYRSWPRAVRLVVLAGVLGIVASASMQLILLPLFVSKVLDASAIDLGTARAVAAVAGIAGAAAYGAASSRMQRALDIVVSSAALLGAVCAAALVFVPTYMLLLVGTAVIGASSTAAAVRTSTVIQAASSVSVRGRAVALMGVLFGVAVPVGLAITGAAAAVGGAVGGAILLAVLAAVGGGVSLAAAVSSSTSVLEPPPEP